MSTNHHSVDAWVTAHTAAIDEQARKNQTSLRNVHAFLTRLALDADTNGVVHLPANKGQCFPGWKKESVLRAMRVLASLGAVLPMAKATRTGFQPYRIDLSDQPQLPLQRPGVDRAKIAFLAAELAVLVNAVEQLQNNLEELAR